MTNQRFDELLKQIKDYAEECNDAQKIIQYLDKLMEDVRGGKLGKLSGEVARAGAAKVAAELGIGEPTLADIVAELQKPGRDLRDDFAPPVLRDDVLELSDLKPGMLLTGTVRNVIDFGAFVDIGVHQDGLVHISELSDKFVKHPREVVSVGDIVQVRVLSVDLQKKRIALSMKTPKSTEK